MFRPLWPGGGVIVFFLYAGEWAWFYCWLFLSVVQLVLHLAMPARDTCLYPDFYTCSYRSPNPPLILLTTLTLTLTRTPTLIHVVAPQHYPCRMGRRSAKRGRAYAHVHKGVRRRHAYATIPATECSPGLPPSGLRMRGSCPSCARVWSAAAIRPGLLEDCSP
eukprot:6203777-Pleurochrysis_carterae.AAC.2